MEKRLNTVEDEDRGDEDRGFEDLDSFDEVHRNVEGIDIWHEKLVEAYSGGGNFAG